MDHINHTRVFAVFFNLGFEAVRIYFQICADAVKIVRKPFPADGADYGQTQVIGQKNHLVFHALGAVLQSVY